MVELAEWVGSSAVGERAQRIVATAVELAEQGGFENVRLREVAASSGVALGTLYRHFRSKEDLLLAALAQEVAALEARMAERRVEGPTPLERVTAFFRISTRAFCRRPNLARAVLRAVASADHGLTEKVARFHDNMSAMIIAALRARRRWSTRWRARPGSCSGSEVADRAIDCNLHLTTSAYAPKYLPAELVHLMNTRGQEKRSLFWVVFPSVLCV